MTRARRWIVAIIILLAMACATTLQAQGSYSAQITAALQTFVRTAHTWTATQTFGAIVVSGCTGCGGGGGGSSASYILAASPSTATDGIIFRGTSAAANRFMHDFSPVGGNAENTFVGLGAGNFTMTFSAGEDASLNTGIGWQALNGLTTGFANVFVGDEAGQICTTCHLNVGIGHQAGTGMIDGEGNTMVGVHAGKDMIGADFNVAIGANALSKNQTGNGNTAVGNEALSNTTSFANTAVGNFALAALLGGFSNVALGDSAISGIQSGISNIGIGYNVGAGIIGSASGNTIIGTNGAGTCTSCSELVIIGDGADAGATTTDSIAIGSMAVVSADHMAVIGTATQTKFQAFGTFVSAGGALAVANVGANSCGTTAASVVGTDNGGEITVGATSATQCRVTFAVAAPTRRVCSANDATTTIAVRSTYVDSTHTDFLGAFVAADHVAFTCNTF